MLLGLHIIHIYFLYTYEPSDESIMFRYLKLPYTDLWGGAGTNLACNQPASY